MVQAYFILLEHSFYFCLKQNNRKGFIMEQNAKCVQIFRTEKDYKLLKEISSSSPCFHLDLQILRNNLFIPFLSEKFGDKVWKTIFN